MATCKFCNQENAPDAITCAHCGANIETSCENISTGEKPSTLLKVVSFFFPLVGIILYFIKRNENRTAAKAYGKMALISIIIGVVCSIVATIALFAGGIALANKAVEEGNITLDYDTEIADGATVDVDENVDDDFAVILDGTEDDGFSIELNDVEDSGSASDDTNTNDTAEEFVVPAIE